MSHIETRKAVMLTERQKAHELQCSLSYLRKDRMKERPDVPFRKIGNMVRYFPTELELRLDEVAS